MQVGQQKAINVIKRAIKIFWRIVVATSCFLFAAALAIQIPQVQTYIAEKAVSKVADKLDGDITFEKVHFKPFTTFVLKNVTIIDRNPYVDPSDSAFVKVDTFFRAEYVIAKFSLEGLTRHEGIHLDRAFIDNAQMNLVIESKPVEGKREKSPNNLSRIFGLKKPEKPKVNEKEIFQIKKVEIKDMGFAMKNHTTGRDGHPEGGINWDDLDIRGIDLKANGLKFKGGIMSGEVTSLSFHEKSGYTVEKMSGSAKVGRGRTIVEDLHIDDLWSDVHLPLFMMSYDNIKAFQDFLGQVKLDGNIAESSLDFQTISYFAPTLKGNHLNAVISGHISGFINDFSFTNIAINSTSGGFRGKASGRLTGIPDIEDTYLTAKLENFRITSDGLGHFITQWMRDGSLDIGDIAKGTEFRLNAKGTGMMNSLKIDASITSQIGKADANVRLDNVVDPGKRIGISGKVSTEDLDIGRILDSKLLGPVTLKSTLSTKIGSKDEPTDMKIDTLKVSRLHANGYDYSNIAAVGSIASNTFNGSIACNDPNLNFLFQGAFALSSKTQNARYKFFAILGNADLNAINIDKRGISRVNLRASADFTRINTGNVRGEIGLADIVLQNSMGTYQIGDVNMRSYSSDSTYTIRFDSKFANGSYSGTAPVTTFAKDLRDITLKEELPALFEDASYDWQGNSYGLDFRFHNSMDLLSFVMPGLYIDEGTQFKATLDKSGHLDAFLNSNRLAFKKNYLKGISVDLCNENKTLDAKINCSEMRVASFTLNDTNLDLHGEDNKVGLKFAYENEGEQTNTGELILRSAFSREGGELETALEFLPSSVFINSKEWDFTPSEIVLRSNEVDVRKFAVTSGDERISLAGKASKANADTLSLDLERFDISIVENILRQKLGIKGIATGSVQLTSPLKRKGILVDMICDSTYFADSPLGVLHVGSKWNEQDQNFNILARNEIDGRNSIDAYGTFRPLGKRLDLTANLDRFSVSYAQPVLSTVFSEMDGSISGRIDVSGPLAELDVRSFGTRLENGMLRIDYTDVPYFVDGPFHLDATGAYFDNISLRDRYNGTGNVNGSINWNHFKDMSFNTLINLNQVEGINISEDRDYGFYGNVFGTGNVSITGPSNAILLTVDAITAKQGQLHIPITSAATGKTTDLLRFTEAKTNEKIDPYEAMMVKLEARDKVQNEFDVKIRVNAQPEVEAFVEIDKASGNVLSGYGSGLIDLDIGADRFNINGDYMLQGGNYRFTAMNLVTKDFQIEDESSIRFNGDIMNSTLDINATYKTKASLSTLLADENSVANKRNVNCGISITGKLSNPELGFSIDIPDLNPMIKSRVESAMSTEDKVQKQFLYLILTNSFLPDEQSGIANNSSMLYSNVTEALANQLNNIFDKLDIPVDLGLKYQPNESGNDMFDVAVSTQLFNNRVVVNGNIGNQQYTTSGTQSDVVGDLDIEIKLNRSGAFRLNLFSHSADQFSNYLDNSQRNGVGLMYQTEFNSFRSFIRNIFKSRAKRQEAKMMEEQSMLLGEKVHLYKE